MTVDELLRQVNGSWGWAAIELSRKNGEWHATFPGTIVMGGDDAVHQSPFGSPNASAALRSLIEWLRGKRVRHLGTHGNPGGPWVDVPMDLEFLSL